MTISPYRLLLNFPDTSPKDPVIAHLWEKAGRVIGDRGSKALGKILRRHIAIDGVKRRDTAHRLAENGDPRRIDELLLR